MASELLRIRVRADAGNTQGVLGDLSRSILGLTVGAAGARGGMMGLAAALSGAQITGRLAAAAVGAVGFGMFGAATATMRASGQLEQFRVNLNALLKDRPLVDAMVASIEGFASRTTFANAAVFEVAQGLVAARVPLNNILPTLQMLGDVSLGNAEKFAGIATAWTQIITKGKITAEEINQIAERGVGVWAILAEETKKSIPELQKMAEAGKLTVDAFMPILQKGLAERYAGSLAQASKVSTNLAANITKSVATFATVIGGGLESTVNPFMVELARLFQRAALYARALVASQIWQRFTQSLQAAADALMPLVRALGAALFVGLVRAVQALTPAIWLLAGAFRGVASAAQAIYRFFKPLLDSFGRLAGALKAINWQGIWQSLKGQSEGIIPAVTTLLKEIWTKAIAWAQDDLLPTLRGMAQVMLDGFATALAEHPMETLATLFGGRLVAAIPAVIAAVKQAGWSAMIIGGLLGAIDVSAGIDAGDGERIGRGIIEMIAGAVAARAKGGLFGVMAAVVAGAIYDDVLAAVRADEGQRAQKIWEAMADVLLVAAVAFPWTTWLAKAATAAWGGLINAMKAGAVQALPFIVATWAIVRGALVSWAAGAGAWLVGLGPVLLAGVQAAFAAMAFAVPALVWASVLVIIARFVTGVQQGDWASIGAALLGALALAIGIMVGGIPALAISAVVALATALFGPGLLRAMLDAWNATADYFSLASVDRLQKWTAALLLVVGAALVALPAALAVGGTLAVAAMTALGAALVTGLLLALAASWHDIMAWLAEAWNGFVQWIMDFLGISSPSRVMADIGEAIMLGLRDGLDATWEVVTTWLATFWQAITGDTEASVEDLGTVLTRLAAGLWADLVAGFQGMWDGAVAGVRGVWQSIREWITGAITGVADTIRGLASVVGDSFYQMFAGAWEGVKGRVQSLLDGVRSMVSSAVSGAMSGAQSSAQEGVAKQRIARENFYKNMGDSPEEAGRKAAQEFPGFASGGQFRVGGGGGVDSQLVAFRATAGETVTVTPAGRQGGSGITIGTINVYANDYEGGRSAARAIRDALGMQRQMLFLTT